MALSRINNPFLSSSGAGNASITSPAANTIAFSTTTTERMRIDSSGKVGIGTASPSHNLTVYGASNPEMRLGDAVVTYQLYTEGATAAVMGTVGSHALVYRTNASERMRIDSSGNVLLGATSATTAPTGYISAANTFGYKNRIINGAMTFWQRGTTFSNTTTFTADRWFVNRAGGGTGVTVSRSGTNPDYFLRIQRDSGNASTAAYDLRQVIETLNCGDLIGQTVTVSFNSYKSATHTDTSTIVGVYSSTNVDELVNGGGWSTITTNTVSPTTTEARYTLSSVSIPAGTKTIMLRIWGGGYVGTAGVDDSIYFRNIQLEKGTVASSFDYRPYTTEQLLCQRYYHFLGGDTAYQNVVTATYYGAGDCVGPFRYPVEMRISPTISKTGTWTALGGAGAAGQTVSADQKGIKNVQLGFTGGTSGVSGQSTTIRASNDSTFRITFDAEV